MFSVWFKRLPLQNIWNWICYGVCLMNTPLHSLSRTSEMLTSELDYRNGTNMKQPNKRTVPETLEIPFSSVSVPQNVIIFRVSVLFPELVGTSWGWRSRLSFLLSRCCAFQNISRLMSHQWVSWDVTHLSRLCDLESFGNLHSLTAIKMTWNATIVHDAAFT